MTLEFAPQSPLKRALSFPQLRISRCPSGTGITNPQTCPSMSSDDAAPKAEPLQDSADPKPVRFEFETHYGVSRKSVADVLDEILVDLLVHKTVHNWDDKLVINPLAALTGIARRYYNENPGHLNSLLEDAVVDEVLTVGGVNKRPSIKQETAGIDSRLFFTKNWPDKKELLTKSTPRTENNTVTAPVQVPSMSADGNNQIKTPVLAQGRIVYIKAKTTALKRASFLVLHSFCMRLQNEDYGFISTFIERHLSFRCVQKVPYHWQQRSPPEVNASRQQCYKRVTLSWHLPYLTLDSKDAANGKEVLDRAAVFAFQHKKDGKDSNERLSLFKASSSVLLTLVDPSESKSQKEETSLLSNPEALWTVLVTNSPSNLAYDHEPAQHLTPIAQYIRGMTSSLVWQRNNAQAIYDAIKTELIRSEGDGLFDDKNFTKSRLYHWAVQACDELAQSISPSLQFLQRTLETDVKKICREAHAYEKLGVEYWMQRIDEEMSTLAELESQILALRGRVQENRHALHGVTAVHEARLASQQGERMKTLAYLATIYLPLTSTTSLYSMSVLPKSASFPSFFVVLAISLLLTILLGFRLPTLLAKWFHVTQRGRQALSFKRPEWTNIDYIQGYVDILNPTIDLEHHLSRPPEHWGEAAQNSVPFLIVWSIFRRLPVLVLHHFLANEVNFPFYQWFLYQHRHNPRMKIYYHWAFFIRDFIRAILLPAWVGAGGTILCYLILQDALGVVCIPALRTILPFILFPFTLCYMCFDLACEFVWDEVLWRIRHPRSMC